MIKRATKPDHSFVLLRNAVVREARLSYRASGVLADILSRPDNWVTSAERLAAARPGQEGIKAIRTALRELEDAGYLRRERTRGDDGQFGWQQTFYDTPQDATAVSAGRTVSPFPPDGLVQGGYGPSQEDVGRTTEEEDVLDTRCTTSSRSAPSGGGRAETKIPEPRGEQEDVWAAHDASRERKNHAEEEDWRRADRKLFRDLIGEKIHSNGSRWSEGEAESWRLYNSLRKLKKPIRWPGKFVQDRIEKLGEFAVDDWLMDYGVEKVR